MTKLISVTSEKEIKYINTIDGDLPIEYTPMDDCGEWHEAMFKIQINSTMPKNLIDQTIVHELCHYWLDKVDIKYNEKKLDMLASLINYHIQNN